MKNVLVSYFSASGTTKNIASDIAKVLNCDIFEIEPLERYTDDDLNYMDKNSRSSIEMQDTNSMPKIKQNINNLDDYDTIVLGFPIWWYTYPSIIRTFLEENNLEAKKIYVFVTSGSSPVDTTFENLKKDYQNLNFINAKRLTEVDNEEIEEWIK